MYMYLVCLPYKAGDMLAWWADTRSRRVSCRITTHQLYWNWTGDLLKTSVTSYIETLLKSLNSECHVDMFLHRALSLAVGSYVFPTTTTETTNLFLNVMPAEPSPHQSKICCPAFIVTLRLFTFYEFPPFFTVQCIRCSSPREDDHWALASCIRQVPPDWKWPAGRPSHTWLRAVEADFGPLNFDLATAWRKATTRDEWWHIVDAATLQRSMLWKKKCIRCTQMQTL